MTLRGRIAQLESALIPDAKRIMPAIELTHDTRLARIHWICTAAAMPEASPELRRAGECFAMMLVERDAKKWLAELAKVGPLKDPNEVSRLHANCRGAT